MSKFLSCLSRNISTVLPDRVHCGNVLWVLVSCGLDVWSTNLVLVLAQTVLLTSLLTATKDGDAACSGSGTACIDKVASRRRRRRDWCDVWTAADGG